MIKILIFSQLHKQQYQKDMRSSSVHSSKFLNYLSTPIEKSPQSIKQIFQNCNKNNQIKCINGNEAYYICDNKNCQMNGFLCLRSKTCGCDFTHSKCLPIIAQKFIENLSKKVIDIKCLHEKIYDEIELAIGLLSCLRDQIIAQIKSINETDMYLGLTNIERHFVRKMKFGQFSSINGKLVSEIRQDLSKQQQIHKDFALIQKKTQDKWKLLHQNIQQYSFTVKNDVKKLRNHSLLIPKQTVFQNMQSRILKYDHEKQNIYDMLVDVKPIKSIQRLYSASRDGWTVETFHLKCDYAPNLLYVVENQYGKKYGAFCPCQISIYRNEKWQTDFTKTSFIFSLDMNTKSNLIQSQHAIRNSKKSSQHSSFVIFGLTKGCNLFISEKSNIAAKDNWISFNADSYQKKPYNLLQVNGYYPIENNSKCRLKQFQVFQVTFI